MYTRGWINRWNLGISGNFKLIFSLTDANVTTFVKAYFLYRRALKLTKVHNTYHPSKIIVPTFSTLVKEVT